MRSIYDHTDADVAFEFVTRLGHDFQDRAYPEEVNTLGRTLIRWRHQIAAWHHSRHTNGPTEAASLKLIATFLGRYRSGGDFNLSGDAAGGYSQVVPSLAKEWSHAPGETHPEVVTSSWRNSPLNGPMLLAGDRDSTDPPTLSTSA